MTRNRFRAPSIHAVVGYAASDRGRGVAYVRAQTESGEQLARVPFRVRRLPGAEGREVGYQALDAVLRALREWGVRRVSLAIEDEQLVEEIAVRRDLPSSMVLPYVRLRCALNAFDEAAVALGVESDLTQRARAEAALHAAA